MNLSTLYTETELADYICPVALELAADKVAEVRQNAFHLVCIFDKVLTVISLQLFVLLICLFVSSSFLLYRAVFFIDIYFYIMIFIFIVLLRDDKKQKNKIIFIDSFRFFMELNPYFLKIYLRICLEFIFHFIGLLFMNLKPATSFF